MDFNEAYDSLITDLHQLDVLTQSLDYLITISNTTDMSKLEAQAMIIHPNDPTMILNDILHCTALEDDSNEVAMEGVFESIWKVIKAILQFIKDSIVRIWNGLGFIFSMGKKVQKKIDDKWSTEEVKKVDRKDFEECVYRVINAKAFYKALEAFKSIDPKKFTDDVIRTFLDIKIKDQFTADKADSTINDLKTRVATFHKQYSDKFEAFGISFTIENDILKVRKIDKHPFNVQNKRMLKELGYHVDDFEKIVTKKHVQQLNEICYFMRNHRSKVESTFNTFERDINQYVKACDKYTFKSSEDGRSAKNLSNKAAKISAVSTNLFGHMVRVVNLLFRTCNSLEIAASSTKRK